MCILTKKVASSMHSKYTTTVCILTKKVACNIYSTLLLYVYWRKKWQVLSIVLFYSLYNDEKSGKLYPYYFTTLFKLTKKVASYIHSTVLLSLYWRKKWQVISIVLYYSLYIDEKSGKSYYYLPTYSAYTVGLASLGQQLYFFVSYINQKLFWIL